MENSGNKILDHILKDAREQAEGVITDANKSAEIIIEKQRNLALQKAKKISYVLLNKAANDADIIRGKISIDIKKQAEWIVLSEKNRLITNVLNEVKNKFMNMKKSKKYIPFLKKLIVDAGTVLDGGILKVILNENDSKLIQFDELEKQISEKSGVQTQLQVSEQKNNTIGVIVKTENDKIFVDNTIEAILGRREKELRLKIARFLFNNMD